MSAIPTEITFFERLIPSILEEKKVITIRDKSESDYKPGSIVELFANEHRTHYGKLKIIAVSPLHYDDINEYHAQQEGMTLPVLKALIKDIYPTTQSLYLIEYQLVK
ncbi:ASCH domain-containing protein [Proteus cibarius]|uniref:N(4)-acetylcytidine aminohydrolase n=1 Tax=Proteus TaxID=583 RepID=UPI000C17340D|nr:MULTISPECIES: N(4)-acetylcytidine aminohydrolase [Proteus]QHP76487.1 ASCH domain-containing protein [Proteus vulgaris]MBG6037955.1 ASCH domain-containing protein [Proteus terrae subsp. cibarius]MCM2366168.1 N(4)-acetylcytidine aminohydrolase [Proteus sp. FZP2095]QHD95608.1 ASCH domain-containing protein [Proteus terrae subsp. cibarius]QIF98100.1 ASCH domain-containing protein [Proteus terrae subsp. cibarius]